MYTALYFLWKNPVMGSSHRFPHGPCPNYSNLWSEASLKGVFPPHAYYPNQDP